MTNNKLVNATPPLHADPLYLAALADLPAQSERGVQPAMKHSIAVLPFVNMGGGEEGEAFADGISEDIITALSRHSELFVIARTSSFAFKGRAFDIKKIASELGVRYVLEGSVRRSGQRLRVTAQLIDASGGVHIWAEKYDGTVDDVFEIQDKVTAAVAAATHTELMLADYGARGSAPTGDPKARELAGKAILKVHEQTKEAIAEGLTLAQKALAMAPDEPRAIRAMALASVSATTFGLLPFTMVTHQGNLDLATKAVEAAPRDEQARLALSWAYSNMARYEEAIAQLHVALEINPSFSHAYGDLGDNYVLLGRAEEAIANAEKAMLLNPFDPSFFWRRYSISLARFILGEFDEARRVAREVFLKHPSFLYAALAWSAAAAACDDGAEAAMAVQHCLRLAPGITCRSVTPDHMSGFAQKPHRDNFIAMLRKAGLPE